jgi:L-threonylcarbamoyladenylate synthase
VRLPDHKQLRELINEVGPIVSTSANLRASKPASSVEEAKRYFGEKLDFYVDVGHLENGPPSTIVKPRNGEFEVIRQGAVNL